MKRAHIFGAFLVTIVTAIIACNLPVNADRIQQYISGTQTAEAYLLIDPTEKVAEPTENISEDPPVASRCDLFSDLETSVFLLEVFTTSPSLVIYIEFPDGVIGLEDGTDDGFPWEYTATLGDVQSLWCAVFEEAEYAGRLYCMLPLPAEYHNAVRPLSMQVNFCETPIVSIPKLSVVVADAPGAGSSGGSSGGSESGEGTDGIQSVFGIFTTFCGEDPLFIGACRDDRAEWCACMGGTWDVNEGMATCDCILP